MIKLSAFKFVFIVIAVIIFLTIFFTKDALSGEPDCKYQRERFAAEQMVKHKTSLSHENSPILIGVDAMFL